MLAEDGERNPILKVRDDARAFQAKLTPTASEVGTYGLCERMLAEAEGAQAAA